MSIVQPNPDPDDIVSPVFPSINSYVVFSIDPWASLAAGHNIDDLSEELIVISSRKYVALVSEVLEVFYTEEHPYHLYQFELLRKGPCSYSSLSDVVRTNSDMSIPVEPAPENHTPWDPLKLSKPLPWESCFHYAYYGWTEVRCRNRPITATPQHKMDPEEKARMTHLLSVAMKREEKQDLSFKDAHPCSKVPVEAINEYLEGTFRVVVDCSYELDAIEDFQDPFLFFKDANYLARLKGPPHFASLSSPGHAPFFPSPRNVVHSILDRLCRGLRLARSTARRILRNCGVRIEEAEKLLDNLKARLGRTISASA